MEEVHPSIIYQLFLIQIGANGLGEVV